MSSTETASLFIEFINLFSKSLSIKMVPANSLESGSMTHDVMSVLTEQQNSLLLVLAAQTQKLDNLEQVCLPPTRSDEQRECSGGGEPPWSEFAPNIEEILQTVEDLKERLANAEAEMLDLQDDLEEEESRVKELQGKLRSAQ